MRSASSMEDSLEELKTTLHNEMMRAVQAIDRKKEETQQLLERLSREQHELRAEQERFEAERASFADSQAALQEELEEVSRLRAELEEQRAQNKLRGFWACCMCPTPERKSEAVVHHGHSKGASVDAFGTSGRDESFCEDPLATRTSLGVAR
mmetsp:Transcript_62282/g.181952  ORF Transcript_62282/g.181952 Transcript_62282/m.181952 type:complete len:152 (-) Transcript_62282:322-777(-)